MGSVLVVDYDREWPRIYEQLRQRIAPALSGLATSIEHVGSTSVPGLAAKPIIDMTVVVPTAADVPTAIGRLAVLEYRHQGNLGIDDREAFESPAFLPRHHLYLCPAGSVALRNHLAVRGYLRTHADAARTYGELKQQLAQRYPEDRDAYTEGKTGLLLEILRAAGLCDSELDAIAKVNRRSV